MAADLDLRFLPLAWADLPRLHAWLNLPHVMTGYGLGRGCTLEEVVEQYGPVVSGADKVRGFLLEVTGRPAGYVQTYRILDHPDYARAVGVTDEAHGVDLFLGDPDLVGRGLGPLVLRRFVEDVVFARTDAVAVVADPPSTNRRSVRALEKAGFRRWREVVPLRADCGDLLLRIDRPA